MNRPPHKFPAPTAQLKAAFDAWFCNLDRADLVGQDPVGLVHRYDEPHDQEVVGLVVAALSYGRVQSIRKAAEDVLSVLGPNPARSVDRGLFVDLKGFVYRFQRGNDLFHFVASIRAVRNKYGSLAHCFAAQIADEGRYPAAASRFVAALRSEMATSVGGDLSYGLRYLLPDPASGGAAKRLWLYLRWMIRGPDGLDLGAFPALVGSTVSAAGLVVPLDTHIARIARYLGLTRRRADDLKTAVEITDALSALDPLDPVRFDMPLCHLGISGLCPRSFDRAACAKCPLQAVCGRRQDAPPVRVQ